MKSNSTTIKNILDNRERKYLQAADLSGYMAPKKPLCAKDCPECHGGGYVRYDWPLGHPRYGVVDPCPRRDLDGQAVEQKFGLKRVERNLSWGNILPMPGSNAVAAARKVREVLERGYGWVYLWGDYGVSKSLILQISTAVSLRAGVDAAYVRMEEVLDHLRGGYGAGDYSQRIERFQSVPVLCIDEFEKVNEKEEKGEGMSWAGSKRFLLMDKRYVSATRGDSVTIMAGNVNPSNFRGELWDRIQDGRFDLIHVTGESVRPGMTWDDGLPIERGSVFERGERSSVFERGENLR